MSVRWKLVLSIVLPLLLLAVVVMWFTLNIIYANAKNRLHGEATEFARSQATILDGKFLALAQIAKSTAAYLEVSPELDEQQLYDLLKANLAQNPLAYGAAIAFESYQYKPDLALFAPYVYRSKSGLRTRDIAVDAYNYASGGWEWYSRPRLFARPIWTEPYFDEGAGNVLMVTYAVPFYIQGQFKGVVTIDIELQELQQQVELENIAERAFVIISNAGNFISHPDPEFIMQESVQSRARKLHSAEYNNFVDDILAARSGVQELYGLGLDGSRQDLITWIFYAPIKSTGWSFSTAVPEVEMTRDVRLQLRNGIIGICVLMALTMICVLLVSTHLTRPLTKLAGAFAQLARGDMNARIKGISSKDEIARLSKGFNEMLDELKLNIHKLGREMAARELVEKELNVAREIQTSLLPGTFPPFPHRHEFELHALNQAAHHVTGDFFDFFFVNDEVLVMVMADVSGKGVPAAMLMAVARTIIRNQATLGSSPAEILQATNRLLLENENPSAFVTLIVACYEPANGRLVYSNAGHQPPYRINSKGEVSKFEEASGTIVGMLDDVSFENRETSVEAGEYIIMYTDGVPEARSPDGVFYGEAYFEALLAANAGASACEICDLTINELNGFQSGRPADDITLLVLRRLH